MMKYRTVVEEEKEAEIGKFDEVRGEREGEH